MPAARVLAILLALGLLAAACGGGDEPATDAAQLATEPPAEEVATEPEPEPATEEDGGSRGLSTESDETPAEPGTEDPATAETTEPEVTEEPAAVDGTPQNPPGGTFSAGPLTVEATRCTIEGTEFVGDSSSSVLPGVAVLGDNVYLIDGENRVTRFVADTTAGCALTLDPTWGDAGIYTPAEDQDALNIARLTGRLVISGSVFSAEVVDTGADPTGGQSYECDVTGEVEVFPTGDFGVAYFPGSPIRQANFSDTGCEVLDPAPQASFLAFENQTILSADFTPEGLFVTGGNLPGPTAVVIAYDDAGTEVWRQGSEDPDDFGDQNYGWVHAVSQCGPNRGICTLDTNFRRLQILDPAGSWLTSVDLNELLGIERAWWEDMEYDSSGRLWMPVGASREDGELADGFVFLLTISGV